MEISACYNTYQEAERDMLDLLVRSPAFSTPYTYEILNVGFALWDPTNNTNTRSDYRYAEELFTWIMSGDREIPANILTTRPQVQKFLDTHDLPINFTSAYWPKILSQIPWVLSELRRDPNSRRAYIHILIPQDACILWRDTTHEYPCTLGIHLFIRDQKLSCITNMRSNNIYSVMPYDVYVFTSLQHYIAEQLSIKLGTYYHHINSAHIYKTDMPHIRDYLRNSHDSK